MSQGNVVPKFKSHNICKFQGLLILKISTILDHKIRVDSSLINKTILLTR